MRSVLVTRPQPVADEFAEKLRREGYNAYVAPMMEYVGLEADPGDLSVYQAIVFTSAQAVQFFAPRVADRNLAVLAVGDATAAAARKAGFEKVFSARGSSEDVAELIKSKTPELELKKVLHPCSDDTADDIGAAVTSLGVDVVQLPVYKAQFLDALPPEVQAALERGDIDVVTVFSTRTAENFVRLLLQKNLRGVSARLEAVCISPTVATMLKELPWRTVRIARQPRMEAVMDALRGEETFGFEQERRKGVDRRQKSPSRDLRGHIKSEAYQGPDRRRIHKRRQRERIMQEKMKFVNRMSLTVAFMFIAVVLVGVFLMAPEYARLRYSPEWVRGMKEKIIAHLPANIPFEGLLSSGIEKAEVVTEPYADVVGDIGSAAADAIKNPGVAAFSQVLDRMAEMRQDADGEEGVTQSMNTLRVLLAGSADHPEEFDSSVEEARRHDKTLDALLEPVKKEDLAAGAMLLVLNEFRGNVDNRRPYAQDLALLQKFAGNDPRMNKALRRLAPYAEKGVMNRPALQAELRALAAEIVLAKLQGKDVSVQEAALKRFEKLSQAQDAREIKGAEADAVVARAQVLLDQGDVKGAIHELQTLEGASAQQAGPWMNDANGYVEADESSDELARALLKGISGEEGFSAASLVSLIKERARGSEALYTGSGVVAPP